MTLILEIENIDYRRLLILLNFHGHVILPILIHSSPKALRSFATQPKPTFYLLNSEKDNLKKALDRASGFLRSRLGQEIRSRHTPELVFYYDRSIERGAEMDEILRRVRQEDERIAALSTSVIQPPNEK